MTEGKWAVFAMVQSFFHELFAFVSFDGNRIKQNNLHSKHLETLLSYTDLFQIQTSL